MSGFVGLFAAASVSCAMKSGSSTTPGGLMPSGAEAKNVYRSRYRSPVLASTTQDELQAVGQHVPCQPATDLVASHSPSSTETIATGKPARNPALCRLRGRTFSLKLDS